MAPLHQPAIKSIHAEDTHDDDEEEFDDDDMKNEGVNNNCYFPCRRQTLGKR
jgi:hypothetical protein